MCKTIATTFLLLSCVGLWAAEKKAQPAAPRIIVAKEYLSYPPLFAESAKTFDPVDLARESWMGWLSKRGIPWGMQSDLKPTLRLPFDCRALPWPSIKTHSVDGPDNNMRALGGLALLHPMLGDEFKNDPAEAGIVSYLQWCSDPLTGIPYSPDGMSKNCAIGHGEFSKNLVLMYRYTGKPEWREWAERALKTLRSYSIESEEPGIGKVATYRQGMFQPGQPRVVDSKDTTIGGWLHLALGWNLWAYAQWYEQTGDPEALEFATALGNRLCHGEDPDGEDGCFRPDGSFGGKSQNNQASWHMHGHTHCLPALSFLGQQLMKAGQREKGIKFIDQASRTFDWLYDPVKNPDAGSMTGWLGEWLMVATGWERQSDCEGCTVGDVVETACGLGAASRLDPRFSDFTRYYDTAEQIYTGQLVEQRFRLTPRYLEVLKENLTKRVDREAFGNTIWQDQSSRANHLRLAQGDAQIAQGTFSKGELPVVRFGGRTFLLATNSAALRLRQFSIHAVVKAVAGAEGQTIIANYDNPINWGKGFHVQITPDRRIEFFTTDGTQNNYDPMISSTALKEGHHIISVTYEQDEKKIWVDGVMAGSSRSKPIDYGSASVAAVGALREMGFPFQSDIAELIVCDSSKTERRLGTERHLAEKFGIQIPAGTTPGNVEGAVLWVKADSGFTRESKWPTAEARTQEVERLYQEAVKTAERMVGQQMGICGFPDWANKLPSDLDPTLPGIHMQGCCADATIRGAHAVWSETVTGDEKETRVNLAFNRKSSLVDVVSSLPHRGELNVFVKAARKVLVRIPGWAPKKDVKAYREKESVPVNWNGDYVEFDQAIEGQHLTVTYPVRIAEIKETVGSLDGTQYTERWRGNTIVDISPVGKWIPMFQRPELDNAQTR